MRKILFVLLLLLIVGCAGKATEMVKPVEKVVEKTAQAVKEVKQPSCEDKAKELIPSKVIVIKNFAGQYQIKDLIWLDGTFNKKTNQMAFEENEGLYYQKAAYSGDVNYFEYIGDDISFKVKFVLKQKDDKWFYIMDHEFLECTI